MSPHGLYAENEQALRRRLRQFNQRTRHRGSVLTGREEIARSEDPHQIVQELMSNWTDKERLLVRHGAFFPLMDKVRRIRNDLSRRTGTFTRSERAFQGALKSIGMPERAIRSAGAEESRRRRKREAEPDLDAGSAATPRGGDRTFSADATATSADATYPSRPAGEPPR